jgi:hypothetical protein
MSPTNCLVTNGAEDKHPCDDQWWNAGGPGLVGARFRSSLLLRSCLLQGGFRSREIARSFGGFGALTSGSELNGETPGSSPGVCVVEELEKRQCQGGCHNGSRSGTLYAHVSDALKVTMAYIFDLSGNMRDTWTGHLMSPMRVPLNSQVRLRRRDPFFR